MKRILFTTLIAVGTLIPSAVNAIGSDSIQEEFRTKAPKIGLRTRSNSETSRFQSKPPTNTSRTKTKPGVRLAANFLRRTIFRSALEPARPE